MLVLIRRALIGAVLAFGFASAALAQVHTDALTKHGVAPRVLDIAAVPATQDVGYVYRIELRITEDGVTREGVVDVIYDPFDAGGLDVRAHVPPDGDAAGMSDSDLRRYLEDEHRLSRVAAGATLYDPATLTPRGSGDVIAFRYRRDLSGPYRFLSALVGEVRFRDQQLEAIELNNAEQFKDGGIDVETFRSVTWFVTPPGGGHLIDRSETRISGRRKGREVEIEARAEALEYRQSDGSLIDFRRSGSPEAAELDGRVFRVNIDYPLPLLGRQARKAGFDIPRPFGVDLFLHAQDEVFKFDSVIVNGEDLTDLIDVDSTELQSTTWLQAGKADVWILPFVNVMAIAGRATSKTTLGLTLASEFAEILDFFEPGSGTPAQLTEDLDSMVYGGGATIAGGIGSVFATLNFQYITSATPSAGTSVNAFVFMPLVGYRLPFINVVAGAQYQDYDKKVTGSIPLEDDKLDFEVLLKAVQWNTILGLQKDLSTHWNFSIMGGFGERTSATFTVGYRFGGPSFQR